MAACRMRQWPWLPAALLACKACMPLAQAQRAPPGLRERLAVPPPCVILRAGGAAGAAHAPALAPAGEAAPAHRALSEDAALDIFVESLAHEQALDSDAAPAPAGAAPAGGAHASASIVTYPARRLLAAKPAAAKPPATAAKTHAAAAKAPAGAPARAAPAVKPLASAEAPVTAPFGEPPRRRSRRAARSPRRPPATPSPPKPRPPSSRPRPRPRARSRRSRCACRTAWPQSRALSWRPWPAATCSPAGRRRERRRAGCMPGVPLPWASRPRGARGGTRRAPRP